MRIVLNVSEMLEPILISKSQERKKAINHVIIEDLEEKYLQNITPDTQMLNLIISEADAYTKAHPSGTRFTVSDLKAIEQTILYNTKIGKRSAQRPALTRRLIGSIRHGTINNLCLLIDEDGNAIKLQRNSTFVIVDDVTYNNLKGKDKVITEKEICEYQHVDPEDQEKSN